MVASVKREGRSFVGMAYADDSPLTLRDQDVKRVHMFDVPTTLRDHACSVLGGMSGGVWWTIGEFRYVGECDYDTAVARRVMRDGRMAIEYGVEICE